jgi:hypothetical protein
MNEDEVIEAARKLVDIINGLNLTEEERDSLLLECITGVDPCPSVGYAPVGE